MSPHNEYGQTKLLLAAGNNRIEEAKKMMKEASDLNIVSELVNKGDNYGHTPLYWASRRRHLQMAELFITNGAEIDKARNGGVTPLMEASS